MKNVLDKLKNVLNKLVDGASSVGKSLYEKGRAGFAIIGMVATATTVENHLKISEDIKEGIDNSAQATTNLIAAGSQKPVKIERTNNEHAPIHIQVSSSTDKKASQDLANELKSKLNMDFYVRKEGGSYKVVSKNKIFDGCEEVKDKGYACIDRPDIS
ncbi:MAG: hypothetical protein OEY94_03640 [Alphaproteobacteria bacterium]|nr:hypothetical protein [Alphaproteobacteria bacterium]